MAITFRTVLALLAEVQRDVRRRTDLKTLAERASRTPTHFQRVFRAMIGESAKTIVARTAMERAAAALLTTDASILEVALDSGFESHEGFTRAFRRHFGQSPAQYRRRGFRGVGNEKLAGDRAVRHRDIAGAVAPCLGLFRTSISKRISRTTHDRRILMEYTIEKKHIPETHVLVMRKRTSPDGIADTLAEVLPQVFTYATGKGVPLAGPPFCRYRDWNASGVTVEAGLPVGAPAEGAGDIVGDTIPAGTVASTIHIGPYDTLNEAYAAVEAWMKRHTLTAADDPHEVYLTDPGQVPDPAQWRTEIVWPLAE